MQHKLMLFSLVLIFAAIPITTMGIINIRSLTSQAATPPTASNLTFSSSCSSFVNYAGLTYTRTTLRWSGNNTPPADYWVDWSVEQNPNRRWNTGSFIGIYTGSNTSWTGYLPKNAVVYWRVWSSHSQQHTYGKTFVLCNTQPIGAPVSGYISSFMGPSHNLGIDIALGAGYSSSQAVYSTMKGYVTRLVNPPSTYVGYGGTVDIWSPLASVNGVPKSVLIRYGHFKQVNTNLKIYSSTATNNTIYDWGTYLGIWGCSGRCSGTHVHYEIHIGEPGLSADTLSNANTGNVVNPLESKYGIQQYSCTLGTCVASGF